MSVAESGMGSREPSRRGKVLGILRDALRQKSMGVIEELPDKGIVKYAKPAGVIASLIPVTSPYVTPIGIAIYAIKCKDAVIFSPHPASRNTTTETVRLMREALRRQGAPEDLLQCVERPSIPLANDLMSKADLTIATGGPAMVKAAYSSGKPAYGVGAGNATMVIDETADIAEAARNTADQQDQRQRLGLFGRWQPARRLPHLRRIPRGAAERRRISGRRRARRRCCAPPTGMPTGAAPRRPSPARPGWSPSARDSRCPPTRPSSSCPSSTSAAQHLFSTEKLGTVLAIFKYHGFDDALDKVRQIFETGGKGHSCGIYSFDDAHIHAPGARRAGEPDHGAADSVARQRRHLHQRHADDVEHGLRRLGRQHHQREHRARSTT